jgi:hypothetical protein
MSGNYCSFGDFTVQHIFRDENIVANDLAQQSSGFLSNRGKLYVLEKQMFWFRKPDGLVFGRYKWSFARCCHLVVST